MGILEPILYMLKQDSLIHMINLFQKKSERGFSMLEAIIASGVLMVGLTAVMTLLTVSIMSGRVTTQEYQASNFAREGIEIVRNQRDSNWLAYDTDSVTEWNEGLYFFDGFNYDYTAVATMSVSTADERLHFSVNNFGDTCAASDGSLVDCSAIWYNSVDQYYFQSTNSSDLDLTVIEKTPFQRIITLNPICRLAGATTETIVTTGSCADVPGKYESVGVQVISTVHWPGQSGYSEYVLEEHLYDWK